MWRVATGRRDMLLRTLLIEKYDAPCSMQVIVVCCSENFILVVSTAIMEQDKVAKQAVTGTPPQLLTQPGPPGRLEDSVPPILSQ